MSSESKKTLSEIPVKVVGQTAGKKRMSLHWTRRTVQVTILILLVLIPVTGLFRIDPVNGALVVLDHQIWFADFFLISGLWITVLTLLVGLYSLAGTVFCGWACPQNTMAEWANHMTHKLLGKRAEVSLDGEAPKVAAAKNKVLNWVLLGLSLLGASMLFALLPLLYFYPPDVVWAFIAFQDDPRLAGSLHWIYSVWVVIIFLDFSVLRHFWCRFACVYKVWQHSFKTKETLHVAYDSSRASECEKCNYCVTTCFIDLDPRKTDVFDSCINCGDCIDACSTLQAKRGKVGLLKFELGQTARSRTKELRDNSVSLLARSRWAIPFGMLGLMLLGWGIWSYQPYHLSVGYVTTAQNQSARDYRIEVSSKRYRPSELGITVEGLDPREYVLSGGQIHLETVGRASVYLTMSPAMRHGFHPFIVTVKSSDGWSGHFRMQHFAE